VDEEQELHLEEREAVSKGKQILSLRKKPQHQEI